MKKTKLRKLQTGNTILWVAAILIHPLLAIIPIGPDGDGPVPPFLHLIVMFSLGGFLVVSNGFLAQASEDGERDS